MNCKNCGQEVDKLDIICPNCKARLDDDLGETNDSGHIMDVEEFLAFDDEPKVAPIVTEKPKKDTIDDEFEYYDDEDDGGFFGSKALIIILIIILIAAAGLAIKFLILNDDYQVVDTNEGNQAGEVVKPDNSDQQTPVEPTDDEPDVEEPEEHRDVNISKALENISTQNKNIDIVKYNSQLKHSSSKDYGVYDVNKSKTFDNYWKDVKGSPYYYDEAILGTLVSFNSKWIDYVNKGDKSVFSMVQDNSRADRNLTGFDKEDIVEEFLLFEVGDIRKGSSGYYVWAHEKIKVISTEKTEIKEYYWIYKLVEGNGSFYVADYYMYD